MLTTRSNGESGANEVILDGQTYTFDHVGDEDTTQSAVFDAVGAPLVVACMAGYNSTIFAYGQTGAGKTYTMHGSMSDPRERGLMPRVLERLFGEMDAEQARVAEGESLEIDCRCSLLEIYNEHVSDLLDPAPPPETTRFGGVKAREEGRAEKKIVLREDAVRGICVDGVKEEVVTSAHEALQALNAGLASRHVGSTAMNATSSRSHTVFTLNVQVFTSPPSCIHPTTPTHQVFLSPPTPRHNTHRAGLLSPSEPICPPSPLHFAVGARVCRRSAARATVAAAPGGPRGIRAAEGHPRIGRAAARGVRDQPVALDARQLHQGARVWPDQAALPRVEAHLFAERLPGRQRQDVHRGQRVGARPVLRRDARHAPLRPAGQDDAQPCGGQRGVARLGRGATGGDCQAARSARADASAGVAGHGGAGAGQRRFRDAHAAAAGVAAWDHGAAAGLAGAQPSPPWPPNRIHPFTIHSPDTHPRILPALVPPPPFSHSPTICPLPPRTSATWRASGSAPT